MSANSTEVFSGQCACRNIKYEATLSTAAGLPSQSLCHCLFCKRITGSVFTRSILVPADKLKVVSGELKQYVHNGGPPEEAILKWHFCPTCGTQIYSENKVVAGHAILRVGTLDRQDEFRDVQLQLFCKRESGWVTDALNSKEGKFDEYPAM